MKRVYQQKARATAKASNTQAILEAAARLFSKRWYDEVTLRDVADGAGTGVQTLLRHFPTKEVLFQSAASRALEQADRGRSANPGATLEASVGLWMDYYEHYGALIVHYLNQVGRIPELKPITRAGSAAHSRWMRVLFSPFLLFGIPIADRAREVLLDIRTWEHLRLRQGLTPGEARRVCVRLLEDWRMP